MRKLADITNQVLGYQPLPVSARRAPIARDLGITALVLVRHRETAKAILVSDSGIHTKAVWVPKAMLTIHEPSARGILVATMSKAFARQKNLHERFIDPELFNEATREVLADAVARAARKRNSYRGHREGNGRHVNQNAFA